MSTYRLMHTTAPGECYFMLNFPVVIMNVVIVSVELLSLNFISLFSVFPEMYLLPGWSLPIIRTSNPKLRRGQTALLPALTWEIL